MSGKLLQISISKRFLIKLPSVASFPKLIEKFDSELRREDQGCLLVFAGVAKKLWLSLYRVN